MLLIGAIATIAGFAGLAGAGAAPALALVGQFGEEGEGAGQFGGAGKELGTQGIAINQETGEVYIADSENDRVVQFSGQGSFIRAWGYGVADGKTEAFQVCGAAGPCFAGLAGSAAGQLSAPEGIAVDNSAGLTHGDVYVQDTANNRIERYGPNGEFILVFGGEVNKTAQEKGETANEDVCPVNPGDVCQAGSVGPGPSQFEALGRGGIAVGPGGIVYVADVGRVQKFAPSGAPEGEILVPEAGAIEALVVDSSGDLYDQGGPFGVHKYDGAGKELGERDPTGGQVDLAIGPADELIINDRLKEHLLIYDPSGAQLASVAPAGASDARGGIAYSAITEAVYAIHVAPARVTFQTLPPPGPLILEGSESADALLPTSATLHATINPEGGEPTHYHFQYGTTSAYGSETAETLLEGEAFEDQPAKAQITGLQPATTYHFRAVATNGTQTTLGADQTFTTAPPVSIDEESAADVTATSAKLLTELNAHGLPSEFHFEYGLTSAYEKGAVPIPDASAGQGTEDVSFSVKLQELLPEHTYHFRVVAHNSLGVTLGADRTFTTQGQAPALADGRAYEMVSPPVKHGVSLEAITREGGLIEAAADGSALAYVALGPVDQEPQGNRSSVYSELLSRRGGGSWETQDIATPHQGVVGVDPGIPSEYKQFSTDLSRGVVEPEGATALSAQTSERTPYRREADGSFTPLVSAANVPAGTKFGGAEVAPEVFAGGVHFITATPDMSHMLLRSPTSLVQGFENAGQESVYEWSEGSLRAVSLIPALGAGSCGGSGPACVPAGEEGTAKAGNANAQLRGAISTDGSRAFFETVKEQRLYLRDMARGQTLRLDEAEAGLKASPGGAVFQLASEDASKVFFTDEHRLTKEAKAKPSEPDLYECAVVLSGGKLACRLTDLSVDPHPGEAADVQGAVLGADRGGRLVYFVARGALSEGALSGECPGAGEGQCLNLYQADTQTGAKRLVAALSEEDAGDWRAGGGTDLSEMSARVSPDGRYLAFMSLRPLTGFDNRDAKAGERDEEVFLFDEQTGLLRCASCDPSAQRPEGAFDSGEFPGLLVDRPALWAGRRLAGSLPGWTKIDLPHALHQARYLSDEGRLIFNSPIGLVPGDGNGAQDVYEYEPAGVGSCQSAQGCVNLISSGSSSEESALLDASENGGDIFFLTAAQLSGADHDNALDAYDAHVCSEGGCPPQAIGAPPPCVSADACRAAPTPQPGAFSAPASATFSGAGNLTPPTVKGKAKAKLTRHQKLLKALKACKKKPKAKRKACERAARRRYGAKGKRGRGKKKG
jgi:hypothetical protein